MSWIGIYLLRLLAFLPLSVLHHLASLLAFVMGTLIGYRKKAIDQNFQRSFPEYSTSERIHLRKAFYHHLADFILETVKISRFSDRDWHQRISWKNPEVIEDLLHQGKDVMIMLGHTGNWEWAGLAAQARFSAQCLPVYRPLHNSAFDHYFLGLRTSNGALPIVDKEAPQRIMAHPSPKTIAMLADQTPGGRKGWWTTFLNQDTPFFRGSEILAKRLNFPIVYGQVTRVKRGYYEITLELLSENPQSEAPRAITNRFVKMLEASIKADPVNWLWSHRRWKHTPKANSTWITEKPNQ